MRKLATQFSPNPNNVFLTLRMLAVMVPKSESQKLLEELSVVGVSLIPKIFEGLLLSRSHVSKKTVSSLHPVLLSLLGVNIGPWHKTHVNGYSLT